MAGLISDWLKRRQSEKRIKELHQKSKDAGGAGGSVIIGKDGEPDIQNISYAEAERQARQVEAHRADSRRDALYDGTIAGSVGFLGIAAKKDADDDKERGGVKETLAQKKVKEAAAARRADRQDPRNRERMALGIGASKGDQFFIFSKNPRALPKVVVPKSGSDVVTQFDLEFPRFEGGGGADPEEHLKTFRDGNLDLLKNLGAKHTLCKYSFDIKNAVNSDLFKSVYEHACRETKSETLAKRPASEPASAAPVPARDPSGDKDVGAAPAAAKPDISASAKALINLDSGGKGRSS